MPPAQVARRLLLAIAVAAGAAGCAVAYKTDLLRKDVLTDAQQPLADTKLDSGDLTIVGSVDRQDTTYDLGKPIILSVKTSKDAHAAILRVLPSGDTAIVFPNRPHRDAAIRANTALTVGGPDDPVKIAADKPGVVLFLLVASTSGTSWLFTRAPDSGSDFADLGVTTRNIAKDLLSTLRVGTGTPSAATHLTVRIAGGGLF